MPESIFQKLQDSSLFNSIIYCNCSKIILIILSLNEPTEKLTQSKCSDLVE